MFEYLRVREWVDWLQTETYQDDYAIVALETSWLRNDFVNLVSANDDAVFRFTMKDSAEKASFQEAIISTEPDFSMCTELQ